jgi:hypothetical protein
MNEMVVTAPLNEPSIAFSSSVYLPAGSRAGRRYDQRCFVPSRW